MTSKMLAEEDEEEHRGQEGHVPAAIGADGLHDDAVLDELDTRLGHRLRPGGHQRTAPARGPEQPGGEQHRGYVDQPGLVEGHRGVSEQEVGPLEQVRDRGELEGK